MTTTPTAAPRPPGTPVRRRTRCLAVAATASSMSVAAHAAGGASPSVPAAVAVVVATTLISAVVLRRVSSPATGHAGAAAVIGAVVLVDQLVGHVLLHLGHLVSAGQHAAPSMDPHHAMSTHAHAHAGHAMSAMSHGGPETITASSVSMLLPSPTMLAAHAVGAAVAGVVLAAAFVLADRVTTARHRALSRPRPPVAVGRPSRRRATVIGTPMTGHVRPDRSRGPPLQLV